jgi:glycosyltransferase involved in cell wall biosynthesis
MAVAESLRRAAIELGAPPERTLTVPNGVDAGRFRAHDREEARRALGLDVSGRIVLCVGHLVARKGFQHVVRSLRRILAVCTDARLVIVGAKGEEGDFSRQLRRTIDECGVAERVLMPGAVANEDLALWYSAADVFCLASEKEGRANVLLEALACGTPVVATAVWGTPEIVCDESLGILVERTDPETLAGALLAALAREWDRERLVRHASGFSWDATAASVEKALAGLAEEGGA